MPRTTRLVGTLLIVIGVLAYLLTGAESVTALIPALLGAVILVLGLLARQESLRRHAVHGALVVAVLGLLGTLMQVAELPSLLTGGTVERPGAVIAATASAIVCAVYVVLGIRSFSAARRSPS